MGYQPGEIPVGVGDTYIESSEQGYRDEEHDERDNGMKCVRLWWHRKPWKT